MPQSMVPLVKLAEAEVEWLLPRVVFPGSPGAGGYERGGAGDADGDAPCAPPALPLQRYSTVNSSAADSELSPT
jgi:hypothetical protein